MSADPQHGPPGDGVEMPRPMAWPIVLALGVTLLGAGLATSYALSAVGIVLFVVGLAGWVGQLLPGRGHVHEPLEEARPLPVIPAPGTVERLAEGMPGYRMRLPERVHPISAGVKGGIVGGLVMPVPAVLWGLLSGHGIFYPVNLLAGMVLPGLGQLSVEELEQFHLSWLVVAVLIHVAASVALGLIYGVLLPTLPTVPRALAWGGALMPLFWTAVTFSVMGVVNPVLARGVDWPWFIASQFLFGLMAAVVVLRTGQPHPLLAGVAGGLVGGGVMTAPALLWGLLTGHGIWYPINLLAGLVVPQMPAEELGRFHADWFAIAGAIHVAMSVGLGLIYTILLRRLPFVPPAIVWGGVVLPLLWTGASYGLMGVINPPLQAHVDWPWFVVSQFIFGVAAAVVVVRSEMVHIPPAGAGPDILPLTESSGQPGGQP